jgi:hypothetical protein
MLEDFHYYCVAVVARAAGFPPEDALTIAYASQYVDHATESRLIYLDAEGDALRFDPVRSAHYGLGTVNWSTQKRIFIPFHFLPPEPFHPEQRPHFSFETAPGSRFAHLLLSQAAAEPLENHKRRLCRIGVALHTFADTWAHQTFTGRRSPGENEAHSLQIYDRERGTFQPLGLERLLLKLAPQIGHAEAGLYPDLAYARWRYSPQHDPESMYERDNTPAFLTAAQAVYRLLLKMVKKNTAPIIAWEQLEPTFRRLFSEEPAQPAPPLAGWLNPLRRLLRTRYLDSRCSAWRDVFQDFFQADGHAYRYTRETWRRQALKGKVAWDRFSSRDWDREQPYRIRPNFWDSLWVHFHRAALQQRHYVLERLP